MRHNSEIRFESSTVSQLDAARIQIDRAIDLFLNEADYICSITLACAAECVLGERLKKHGIQTITDDLKLLLKKNYAPELSLKEINDLHINNVRNFLKHSFENDSGHFELEAEAMSAIIRAVGNFGLITGDVSDIMKKYFLWLRENHPHLIPSEQVLIEYEKEL